MVYWILLIFTVLLLAFIYDNVQTINKKRIILFAIILILIYFSGFRDGLGVDYINYKNMASRYVYLRNSLIISEPIYYWLTQYIYNSSFTDVLFFLIMAFITILFFMLAYQRYDHLFIILFIFLMFPALYSTSFNLVRGAAISSIFLFSIKYIEKKSYYSFLKFLLLTFFAFCIHKSAIIFIPLYFLSTKDYKYWIIILFLSLFFIVPAFALFTNRFYNLISFLSYENYLDYDKMRMSFLSFSNIFFHLLLIPIIYYRKRIILLKDSEKYIIPIQLFILALFFSNISIIALPISYRFFYLFIPSLPIVIIALSKVMNKYVFNIIVYSVIGLIGLVYFINGINNPLIVPDRILPISSLLQFSFN